MIDYIKGTIQDKSEDYITIESSDKGYIINMPTRCIENIELYNLEKIYTRLIVREDSLTLYGFTNKDERTLFDLLTTVSSVGPKAGMSILSTLSISEIIKSIHEENGKVLATAPGIGKKTADRIILELKDKISKYNFEVDLELLENNIDVSSEIEDPVIEALISLGYNRYEIIKALANIDNSLDISIKIKEALKYLGR